MPAPLIGGLAAVAVSALPALARWVFGEAGGRVGEAAAAVVAEVTGAADPEEAAAALIADPAKRQALLVRLAELDAAEEAARRGHELDELRALLADTASARGMAVALRPSGGLPAQMPALLTLILVAGFFGAFFLILVGAAPGLDGSWRDVVLQLTGTLGAGFGLGVGYWLGSSRGAVELRQAQERHVDRADDLNAREFDRVRRG